MSQPPYQLDEEDRTTIGLFDPPGPPDYPSPPGMVPPGGAAAEGDRVWVHLLWEAVLAVAVIGVFVGLVTSNSGVFDGNRLGGFLHQTAAFGLAASGLAFSLRAAVPNLAIGAIASGTGVVIAELVTEADWALGAGIAVALAAAAVVGLVLGVFVGVFHVPAWAVTLGAAVLISAVLIGVLDGEFTQFTTPRNVNSSGPVWFAGFAILSVVGGALWAVPGLRRKLSGTRQDQDPARRAGAGAAIGAVLALVVSSLLASGAGVAVALRVGAAQPQLDQVTWFAFGAVLLGGVSVFGRRAGIFGTLLAVLLLSLVQYWLAVEGVDAWVFVAITGGAILVGLIVSRLLETAGRKRAY